MTWELGILPCTRALGTARYIPWPLDEPVVSINSIPINIWMRLCQARCQENEWKLPESPLLTARRGRLTVYATRWSQKRGRHFGSLSFFRQCCGPVFFWTTKEQTGAARRSWRPGFRPFAGASLSSAMQAAMDTHVRIILWGDMAQKLLWISEKGPLSGAARSHANLLRSGSMPPLQRVRKLFCVHPGRSLWRAIVAVHPVRALWNIILYTAKAKALKGT